MPHQLQRIAKRPSLALGRLGAISGSGSGDIFIAFSTGNAGAISETNWSDLTMFPNERLASLFTATVEATEEAVLNAMVAAETMVGVSNIRVPELPEDAVRRLMNVKDD